MNSWILFLNLEEQVLSELAYEVGERYFAIQRTEEGYDYSFYDEDFRLMDGGIYENDEISIEEAAEELFGRRRLDGRTHPWGL